MGLRTVSPSQREPHCPECKLALDPSPGYVSIVFTDTGWESDADMWMCPSRHLSLLVHPPMEEGQIEEVWDD